MTEEHADRSLLDQQTAQFGAENAQVVIGGAVERQQTEWQGLGSPRRRLGLRLAREGLRLEKTATRDVQNAPLTPIASES